MQNPILSGEVAEDRKLPPWWRQKFWLYRIGRDEEEITLEQRNEILECMNVGAKYYQLGKSTIMVNSITSIEPKWGEDNIPPRPVALMNNQNRDQEIRLWDNHFGKKVEQITKGK